MSEYEAPIDRTRKQQFNAGCREAKRLGFEARMWADSADKPGLANLHVQLAAVSDHAKQAVKVASGSSSTKAIGSSATLARGENQLEKAVACLTTALELARSIV